MFFCAECSFIYIYIYMCVLPLLHRKRSPHLVLCSLLVCIGVMFIFVTVLNVLFNTCGTAPDQCRDAIFGLDPLRPHNEAEERRCVQWTGAASAPASPGGPFRPRLGGKNQLTWT